MKHYEVKSSEVNQLKTKGAELINQSILSINQSIINQPQEINKVIAGF